jgi:uncharacterized protein
MKRDCHLKDNERQALQRFKELAGKKIPLLDIRLYGSKARGDGRDDSDLDIMVVTEENNPQVRSDIYDLCFELDLEYDTFLSATIFEQRELEEGPLSESPLYKAVMREGISL